MQSVFVPLKQLANEQKVDLSKFFPQIRLEASLKNIEKRNSLLMDELLRRSKGKLQLGLDLKGGVAFTLEVAPRTFAGMAQAQRQEKLTKAIEIISARINSLGVAEPIVRPVGDNRIEVQLPGVSTQDNPEIVSSLKKPARLDFRLVYPGGTPQTIPPDQAPPGYEPMTLEQEGKNGETFTSELYVKQIPAMTGSALSDAYASMDEFGRFKILLRFTKEGAQQFADITRADCGAKQADGRRCGPARHRARRQAVFGAGRGEGDRRRQRGDHRLFTQREAWSWPTSSTTPSTSRWISRSSMRSGRRWRQDAIDSGVKSAIIGAALVVVFMISYYIVGGVIAVDRGQRQRARHPGRAGQPRRHALHAGHCRYRAHHRHGGRRAHPDFRAHARGVGSRQVAEGRVSCRSREGVHHHRRRQPDHAGHLAAHDRARQRPGERASASRSTIGIFTTMFTALIISQMLLELGITSGLTKIIDDEFPQAAEDGFRQIRQTALSPPG